MTLLDNLQSIDLSDITQARASIRLSVSSPELQAILEGGAAQTALAGLGSSLADLQSRIASPEDLLQPLAQALTQLGGRFTIDGLPLEAYARAVAEGAGIVRTLVDGLDQDPLAIGKLFNMRTSGMLAQIQDGLKSYTQVGVGEVSAFRQLIDLVEHGVPTDALSFANLAVDALMPSVGGRLSASLRDLRGGVDGILNGALAIQLPDTRLAGLLLALGAAERAALAGDAGSLRAALDELERVRRHTLVTIQDDLRQFLGRVDGLRLDALLSPLETISRSLTFAQEGALEFMAMIRQQIQAARQAVEVMDTSQVNDLLTRLLNWLEATAQAYIVAPIDAAVQNLKAWLRSLLRELPLFELRAELSEWMRSLVSAIEDAGLDGPAQAVRQALIDLRQQLSLQALTAEVQAALQSAAQAIEAALDGVLDALEQISDAIEEVAGQAEDVLGAAAEAIGTFKVTLDGLVAGVNNLGIDQVAGQVADTIRQLRQTAEEVLSVAPLPEALRPVVEQMIEVLEGIDFDEVLQPVEEAVERFRIPAEVGGTIQSGLQAAKDALDNLIPDQLIHSIQAEIDSALETLRGFDPSSLLPDVSGFLDSAADFVQGLDPAGHLDVLQSPFQTLVDAFDRANPQILLQPLIQAYDELIGDIQIPTPDLGVERFNQALSHSGDALAGAVSSPLQNLVAPGGATRSGSQNTAAGSAAPLQIPQAETVRPGDLVRLFGYLPEKLRQALAAMNASQAGEALAAIDRLTGGLAHDLRSIQGVLWSLEDRLNGALEVMLAPLAVAQLRTQLAIQANFSLSAPGLSLDLDASLSAVALAGPGALRHELAESLRQTVNGVRGIAGEAGGSLGVSLERAAEALERNSLVRLVGDLDALLAALDPEPVAAEIDAFVQAVLRRAPQLLAQVQVDLERAITRAKGLIAEYNPLIQAQKFIQVLDVLREELERLSPRSLAAELGEVHTALRAILLQYDPAVFTGELSALTASIAADLRALDPSTLFGNLSFLDGLLGRIAAVSPAQALSGIGAGLSAVGEQLASLDPGGMLEAVNNLGPQVVEAFRRLLDTLRDEIVALLESLKYAAANASASVSVSASIG